MHWRAGSAGLQILSVSGGLPGRPEPGADRRAVLLVGLENESPMPCDT